MRFVLAAAIVGALCAAVSAEEGGFGHYTPGTFATFTDLAPPTPGWRAQLLGTHFAGSADPWTGIPIAGDVSVGLDARIDAATLSMLYTLEDRILGAFYTVGAYAPFLSVHTEATVSSPIGAVRQSERVSGLGDVVLFPALMAWKRGEFGLGLALPIYAPTGRYQVDRIANTGRNYWTVDPTLSFSYNGESNGFNAALFAGVTFNTTNETTDYTTGSVAHVEASVQQLFPFGPGFLGIGANAFMLHQIHDDRGPNVPADGFRAQSYGIGPVIDYVVATDRFNGFVELRWLPEISTKNRVEGDYFWLKGVIQF